MKDKVTLYPFSPELTAMVRNFAQVQDKLDLEGVATMPSATFPGNDISCLANKESTGFLISEGSNIERDKFSGLLVPRHLSEADPADCRVIELICQAAERGKRIICCDDSVEDIPNSIRQVANDSQQNVELICHDGEDVSESLGSEYGQLRTPVVLVGELIAQADSFDVLVNLYLALQRSGIRALVISRQPIGRLAGFASVNHILKGSLPESKKIIAMNKYVRELERISMPDIILLEAPDPILKYNNIAPNGFGIQSYMLCQAISPDYILCCMPYDMVDQQLIGLLSKDFNIRLGAPISAVCMSNLIVDSASVIQSKVISFVRVDTDMVRNRIDQIGSNSLIPIFDSELRCAEGNALRWLGI